eukprot:TRINITY_DN8490_c0_g2_i3.p1 TRINITY_DN8490_c0_g2~~TRINITY_DN8490_c0_g2_i3.p1  ORF type:complete len:137 (-),score=25.14 TRINITY_DN8490_c0_g2_i3:73-483(-)
MCIRDRRTSIDKMYSDRKERNFLETIELQVSLCGYDPCRDKRFFGSVILPHIIRPNLTICLIGDAAHLEEAKDIPSIDTMSIEEIAAFKVRKEIKIWAKNYQKIICTDTLARSIAKATRFALCKACLLYTSPSPRD